MAPCCGLPLINTTTISPPAFWMHLRVINQHFAMLSFTQGLHLFPDVPVPEAHV